MENPMRKLILSTLSILALLIHPLSLSAQNTFSLSLDVDSAAGNQAVTSNTDGEDTASLPDFDDDGTVGVSDFLNLYARVWVKSR